MATFIKTLFYVFLVIILYIISLFIFTGFWDTIDEKSGTSFNADIKIKIDDFLFQTKNQTNLLDSKIDSVAPNTKDGINKRIEDAGALKK